MRWPSRAAVTGALGSVGAGALVAASMPPWGWWPLAFAGLGVWEWLLAGQRGAVRFRRTLLFAFGWLAPGISWIWQFTLPGYLVVLALFAGLHATAVLALPSAPADRWRWLVLPCALTTAEALRFCFPFGGFPIATLPMSQAGGPFVGIARVGGPILLTFVTAFIGTNVRRVVQPLISRTRPSVARVGFTFGSVAVLPAVVAFGAMVPRGSDTGQTASIVIVQGGGPQGTRAIKTFARLALDRALAETRTFDGPADLVIWPENIVNVRHLDTSLGLVEVAAEAARLGAPLVVGITESDTDPSRFRNAQVVVMPDGSIMSRYEKKRRVPFGEYMPMRSFLHAIGVPTQLVPRDAVAGSVPATLYTPVGTVGVAISWEIFFGGRVREAVRDGAAFIINPTNGASYRGTILQSQQIAASRLRAIESGRWVAQVSPTGFSAFVSPNGHVYDRIGQTEAAWRRRTIAMRSGLTWYEHVGDKPFVLFALLLWSLPTYERLVRRYRRARSDGAACGLTPPPAL